MSVVATPELVRAGIAGRADRGKDGDESRSAAQHSSTRFGDLLVVADAAAEGSHAARMVVDIIASRVPGMLAFFPPEIAVEEAVRQANTELTEEATRLESPDRSMEAAVVVALLRMDSDRAHVTLAHVGNCRAYRSCGRKLTLLTGQSSAEPGRLDREWMAANGEEAHSDPSTLTQRLGQGLNLKVATSEIELEAGDTLLLCSNGLWRSVREEDMERILADPDRGVEETCRALLDLAHEAGGQDNVAIEIARLTHNSEGSVAAARAVRNVRERMVVAKGVQAIEWPAPQPICYGTALSEIQLNATAEAPGTFEYNPGGGAMLVAGEHTLSVVFRPSDPSQAPVQATVPIRVAKAMPSVRWPVPDSINSAMPLGPAQLNAKASVPGSFDYSPGAGERLDPGVHTLLANFTPADQANYTKVQARVPLAVIDPKPAAITWENPRSIPYGTALSEEQLCASSRVPGSFLYIPGPGNVLLPGRHELEVIFTPEDNVKYTETRATVTLIVEELPIAVPAISEALPPADSEAARDSAADEIEEPNQTSEQKEPASLFVNAQEAGDGASQPSGAAREAEEFESEAQIETQIREGDEAEDTLFRAYRPKGGRERTRTSRWLMIASVVAAIPMLCVLAFLIDMARTGDPFHKHPTAQSAPAAGDAQPQTNAQDPSHQVKITISQTSTGDGTQPAQSSGTGSGKTASTPSAARTQTSGGQPVALSETPRVSTQQPGQSASVPARSGRADASEPGGRSSAAEGTSEAADRDAAASSAVPVSADAAAARLMESSIPIYPPAAKAAGITGTVELQATITTDGTVKNVRALSGPVELRQAAVNCARTWRYRPFLANNEPVDIETTISVVFSLND